MPKYTIINNLKCGLCGVCVHAFVRLHHAAEQLLFFPYTSDGAIWQQAEGGEAKADLMSQ